MVASYQLNNHVIFGFITLLMALIIAGTAAWFSIVGLMAIFGGAAISVAVMAGSLELGKVIAVSWLYRNWHSTGALLKSYLILAVVLLMFITSLGIFGFLSRAHIEQRAVTGDNALRIAQLDSQISREQSRIDDAQGVIDQLDNAVAVLQKNDRISGPNGAAALRRDQQEERSQLLSDIDTASDNVTQLQQQRLTLSQQQLAKEVEVGPLKYIAELIYGKENAKENFDQAVRWVIIILVLVFDPMAVALLLAANQTLSRHGVQLEPTYQKMLEPLQTASPTVHDAITPVESVNQNQQDHAQLNLFTDETEISSQKKRLNPLNRLFPR